MKRTLILATVLLGAVALLSTGCGTSDSFKSLELSTKAATSGGFFNLVGVDGTLQLKVTAVYNSGKQVDVTNQSTFTVTAIGTQAGGVNPLPTFGDPNLTINPTGLMTDIIPMCTWTDLIDNSKNPPVPFDPPNWVLDGYYQVTAHYRGVASQPVGIGVGSATSNAPKGGCGPQ